MMPDNSVAVVPAAGVGERLGLGPKAFLDLGDRTLIEHVVETLSACVPRVIVAVPESQLGMARDLLGTATTVIAGAETRQATVARLFQATTETLVVIHDVTRPFASAALVRSVLAAATEYGAAAAMMHPPIPVGVVRDGKIQASYDRTQVMFPQSPQAFRRPLLQQALDHAARSGIERQTTWQLLQSMGTEIAVVPGEEWNIKITTHQDWEIARRAIWPVVRAKE